MESSVRLEVGSVIRGGWQVVRKLGEGGCGVVYEVQNRGAAAAEKGKTAATATTTKAAALKVEPCRTHKDDEILKMEVLVLRLMQKSQHACRLLLCGKTDAFNFVIMSLLGRALSDLRRLAPDQRLSTSTTVRLGAQCLTAISDLHVVGFVHRDVKPANFALGIGAHKRTVFLLDFGLARQFLQKDQTGVMRLRPPRIDVPFRGTVRYCSMNVHCRMEQGRHDDLWSLLYMLIEMVVGQLPWRNLDRRAAYKAKEAATPSELLHGCPREFLRFQHHLGKLTYAHAPDYAALDQLFRKTMQRKGIRPDDPYDWEVGGRWEVAAAALATNTKDDDEQRRRDDAPAQTLIDVGGLDLDSGVSGASDADTDTSAASASVSSADSDVQSTSAADDTLNDLSGLL